MNLFRRLLCANLAPCGAVKNSVLILALLACATSAGERWWLKTTIEKGSWCPGNDAVYYKLVGGGSKKECLRNIYSSRSICIPESVMLVEIPLLGSCAFPAGAMGVIQ